MDRLAEDKRILRDLGAQQRAIATTSRQEKLKDEWRRHNSLKKTRPLVVCSWDEGSNVLATLLADQLRCTDPEMRRLELKLRNNIFHAKLMDDWVFEPFVVVDAVKKLPPAGDWGYAPVRHRDEDAFITDPFVLEMSDLDKLVAIDHVIDEKATEEKRLMFEDIFNGAVDVCMNRRPFYANFSRSDLSTSLGEIMGLENMMLAMYDDPELIHAIQKFMQSAILNQFRQANEQGDFTPIGGWWEAQAAPYCEELADPSASAKKCTSKEIWGFCASQEFTLISPAMFDEFMLQYQIPIFENYGLVAYGCCENLTGKIDLLRKIPNLRRIGIAPLANVSACAEQIQRDYVFALRPNPAPVCHNFDYQNVYKQTDECLRAAQGTCLDITLKDITTVQGDPQRLFDWVKIVHDVAEKYTFG